MKYFIVLAALLASKLSVSQNTFPTSGNVGIGTSSPQWSLDVFGFGQRIMNTGSTGYTTLRLYNDQNSAYRALEIDYSGSAYSSVISNGSPIGEGASIATTGAFPLSLGTNNKTRIFINGGGDVRIGGINDAGNTSVSVGGQTTQYNLDFSGYRDTAPDQIGARISALRFNAYQNNYAGIQNTALAFYTNPYGNNNGTTDLQERVRIDPYGKVGIGTTAPTTNLHIGNTSGGGVRIGGINDAGNIAVAVGLQTAQYNLDFSGYRDNTPDQIGARIAALRFNNYTANNALIQNTGLAFYTNPYGNNSGTTDLQERMRISPSGNVGIGTTSPDAKLAVKGQVHANEVKVDLAVPGPDYVFDKDYKLTSLEDIETYIDQNKHLPEVSSAASMEKNGVQLGEMNMLLLKKIEELTLYAIEQDRRDQDQKKQIENLVIEVEKLKTKK